MSARKHAVKVSLNSDELARLDRARGRTERDVYLRTLLYQPPDISEVAWHKEALAILSRLARAGGTAAAIALERALRDQPGAPTLTTSSRGCSTTNEVLLGLGPFSARERTHTGPCYPPAPGG
jgi:hypothetical protein